MFVFENLKNVLTRGLVLASPDRNSLFIRHLLVGIGAVLSRVQDGKEKVMIAYIGMDEFVFVISHLKTWTGPTWQSNKKSTQR